MEEQTIRRKIEELNLMDVEVDEISATSIVDEVVRLYDIEPQNGFGANLPKRSRYYQALRDVKLLDFGCDYDKLPEIRH